METRGQQRLISQESQNHFSLSCSPGQGQEAWGRCGRWGGGCGGVTSAWPPWSLKGGAPSPSKQQETSKAPLTSDNSSFCNLVSKSHN